MLDRRETLVISSEGHLIEILLTKGDAIGQAVVSGIGILSFLVVATFLSYLLRSIHHSAMCDFQGALNQFGVTGSAVFNLFLAIQTFVLLVLRAQPPRWLKWLALCAGWMFPILMTSLGPALNQSTFSFFGPTSAGCWLTFGSSNYVAWFWTVPCISLAVLLIMIILYVGLFLSLSGILDRLIERSTSVPSGSSNSGNLQSNSSPIGAAEKVRREVRKVARKMLWFPAFAAVLSLPIVVSSYYIVSDCLFAALGIADVFIFVATRHHLLRPRSSSDSSATPSGQRGINMTQRFILTLRTRQEGFA
ncbi:hypothetical protein BDY24DRAFT_438467 [Mrakia frigida]|uniref:uncharacterized protein n=1 Tax=Mrakia frigida TaxID=29902 RepID=UPI003FCC0759